MRWARKDENANYNLSSKGVFTKYVVRIPLPLTGIGPRHSQLYPAAIRTFAVYSVVCERESSETDENQVKIKSTKLLRNCLNIWFRKAEKFDDAWGWKIAASSFFTTIFRECNFMQANIFVWKEGKKISWHT